MLQPEEEILRSPSGRYVAMRLDDTGSRGVIYEVATGRIIFDLKHIGWLWWPPDESFLLVVRPTPPSVSVKWQAVLFSWPECRCLADFALDNSWDYAPQNGTVSPFGSCLEAKYLVFSYTHPEEYWYEPDKFDENPLPPTEGNCGSIFICNVAAGIWKPIGITISLPSGWQPDESVMDNDAKNAFVGAARFLDATTFEMPLANGEVRRFSVEGNALQ